MKVKYFAWVRERIGKSEETIEPPSSVQTIEDLMAWLAKRGETYAYAFETPRVIRAAIDHAHVKSNAVIAGAREIAFFPPMTGG
jgi:molybdopterin synthase sulfur carrier subunit